MSKVKVRLADNIARVIFIEKDATVGAQIGTDLRMPDGTLATAAKLNAFLGTTPGGNNTQDHRLLRGLTLGDDHPQYVRKDMLTTRGDLYVRGATAVQRLGVGTTGQLLRSDGTDALWATLSPVITLGTDLSGSATLTNLASATLNGTIVNNAVTDAKLRDSGGLSVIGRSASTTGDPADILAASDGDVLRRSGATVGFGQIRSAAIDLTTTDRILGRDTSGGGAAEELTLSQVLDMVGGATRGDLLYRGGSSWLRLPIGDADQVLTSDGTDPLWVAAVASSTVVYSDGSVPVGNTVANTTTQTTFASTYTFDHTSLLTGRVIRVKVFGVYGSDASPSTLRLRVKLGGTTLLDTTAFTTAASITAKGWSAEGSFILTDDGAGGTVNAQGLATFSTGVTTADVVHLGNASDIAVDMSVNCALEVTAQWGAADADNTITMEQMIVSLERVESASDPFVALLHFEGADTSTTMTDQYGTTWTAEGDAQIDTAEFKWGAASLHCDGTTDEVESATNADFAFGTGDFTIECWIRYDTRSGNNFAFIWGANWGVYTFSSTWAVFDGAASNVITGGTVADDTWYHVAISRQGTNLRLFIDGVQTGSTATNSTNHTTGVIRIGSQTNGWIDEFRVAREAVYTANFTPPSGPFPDP